MAFRFVEEEEEPVSSPQAQGQRYRFVEEEERPAAPQKTKAPLLRVPAQSTYSAQDPLDFEKQKTFLRNAANAASLGLTDYIDILKPQEGEDSTAALSGQVIGSVLPITGASKAVGYGLKGVSKAVENAPAALKFLSRFAHGFGTGSLYESGKQAVNVAQGKKFEPTHIPTTGSLFGVGEGLVGALADKFSKLSLANQAKILEERVIPPGLSNSQYETAEEVLDAIRRNGGPPPPPGGSGGVPPPGGPGGPSRTAPFRVKPGGEDMGLRPAPAPAKPELKDTIGNIFSNKRFYNTTEAGRAYRNEITKLDREVYAGVNDLYKLSREANSKTNEIQTKLVEQLQDRIGQIESIPEPSDVQKRLLRASQQILKNIATFGENGEVTGYLPINNQVLIDQIQALRQIVDYDFSHGNTKNIFKPLIRELQEAVIVGAESSGNQQAITTLRDANNAYRLWSEAFDNDYVRPFRDMSNQDLSKLFKGSLDLDEFNMLKRVLNTSPKGQELLRGSQREIVEKHLGKFFDNPRGVNPRDFDTALRELEAVITPEETQQIREAFHEASSRTNIRARQQVHQPTNEETIAAKYTGKEPEDVMNMMNSRSGIRRLRDDLSGSSQKKELFEKMAQKKMRSVLRSGNIENDATGTELYKFLNNEHNYELFSEILGENETEFLRLTAKDIGKKQLRTEALKKVASQGANKLISLKALHFIMGVL